jgi:hypothetical protein
MNSTNLIAQKKRIQLICVVFLQHVYCRLQDPARFVDGADSVPFGRDTSLCHPTLLALQMQP